MDTHKGKISYVQTDRHGAKINGCMGLAKGNIKKTKFCYFLKGICNSFISSEPFHHNSLVGSISISRVS